jgi:hypothetical protein
MSGALSSRRISHGNSADGGDRHSGASERSRRSDPAAGVVRAAPGSTGASSLLSARDAAVCLGVSLTSFRDHVAADLPCVRIGRRVLYDPRDLQRWIEARKASANAPVGAVSTPSPRAREILADLRRR